MSRDTSNPGYPELYDWPEPLTYPVRISGCGWYRDGTYYVDLEDGSGRRQCFFFDHFLGRLCYGEFEEDEFAAFLRPGSRLEQEAFALIESLARQSEDYAEVIERLRYAKTWIHPPRDVD